MEEDRVHQPIQLPALRHGGTGAERRGLLGRLPEQLPLLAVIVRFGLFGVLLLLDLEEGLRKRLLVLVKQVEERPVRLQRPITEAAAGRC